MNIAAGTFTGNGADNRRIWGLGFKPLAVFVKGEGQMMMVRFRTQLGDLSKTAANTVASQADCIQSIDYDGFTLGSNAKVNNDATTFYWLAIGETTGQAKAIRYTGNGTTQSITGAGFAPAWVFIYADTAGSVTPIWKSNTCTNSITFSNIISSATAITTLDADGFSLGGDSSCNANGTVYHALCLLEVAGSFQTLTYPGNSASASISTTGAGFRPTVVLVAKEDGTTGRNSAGRWVGQSGDSSALAGGSSTTDLIESLDTDGFTVGQAVNVNEGTSNYHALVFKASAVLSSVPLAQGRRLSPILRGQAVGSEHVRELQDRFDRVRGHTHSGAADDGPRIATTTVTDLDAALFGDVVATRFTGGNAKGSSGLVADAQHIHNTPTHEHTGALSGGTFSNVIASTALWINETTNANMTIGATLNQGANVDEILSFKGSDIAHGMTGLTETDTFASFKKAGGAGGGLEIAGYSEAVFGVVLAGLAATEDTTKSTSATAPIALLSATKSGTSITSVGADGNLVVVRNNGSTRLIVDAEGTIHSIGTTATDSWGNGLWFLNDTANAQMTLGLTLNQGANDNEILAFKSSDIAHGMTTITETDTFAYCKKYEADAGGLGIAGFSESASPGVVLAAAVVTDTTTKATTSVGHIMLVATTKSGTTVGDAGADANLVVIRNNATTRFAFDAEGSAHADIEWIAFDDYDDVALLADLERALVAERDPLKRGFTDFLQYNRAELEQAKIVRFDRENPGHAMVNTTRLSMLLVGAVRQSGDRITRLERQLRALRASS